MIIIGHRGAKGYIPENTIASFEKAIAIGVDMIELDVYALKSGEIVVIHDPTVDRTTNGTGNVADYTFSAIRKLDAGNGQLVPLLTEVLDIIHRRMPINIELKGAGSARGVAKIIRHYTRHLGWRQDLFLVSSFDIEELRTFARLSPKTPTATLFTRVPASYWQKTPDETDHPANISVAHLTRKTVQNAHKKGMRVYAYTINSRSEAQRMRKLFVDGIFSDYPDRVSSLSARPRRTAHSKRLLPSRS